MVALRAATKAKVHGKADGWQPCLRGSWPPQPSPGPAIPADAIIDASFSGNKVRSGPPGPSCSPVFPASLPCMAH